MTPSTQQSGNGISAERSLCKRCGEQNATHDARQDRVCADCFVRFINTKVIKRMELFRGQQRSQVQSRKLLLPISLGASSASLLHILDGHVERQIHRTGQANYQLHCLLVLDGTDLEDDSWKIWEKMQSRYPRHQFTSKALTHVSEIVPPRQASGVSGDEVPTKDYNAQLPFDHNAMASLSSRYDMAQMALTKTIVDFARASGCDGILWGYNTTRLAEKVLAETAKGRGSSLPLLVNNGQYMDGMSFLYPMKDVLKKEVLLFAETQSLSTSVVLDKSKSSLASIKNSTIDSLMTDYFQSVEENYPSIVANVVRTSSKLQFMPAGASNGACELCNVPLSELQPTEDVYGLTNGRDARLCYGCDRLMKGEVHHAKP